jgi:hypothetical protein
MRWRPIALAGSIENYAIALDASNVYWSENIAVTRSRSAVGRPAARRSGTEADFRKDRTNVYFTLTGHGVEVPITGGPVTLAPVRTGRRSPSMR